MKNSIKPTVLTITLILLGLIPVSFSLIEEIKATGAAYEREQIRKGIVGELKEVVGEALQVSLTIEKEADSLEDRVTALRGKQVQAKNDIMKLIRETRLLIKRQTDGITSTKTVINKAKERIHKEQLEYESFIFKLFEGGEVGSFFAAANTEIQKSEKKLDRLVLITRKLRGHLELLRRKAGELDHEREKIRKFERDLQGIEAKAREHQSRLAEYPSKMYPSRYGAGNDSHARSGSRKLPHLCSDGSVIAREGIEELPSRRVPSRRISWSEVNKIKIRNRALVIRTKRGRRTRSKCNLPLWAQVEIAELGVVIE